MRNIHLTKQYKRDLERMEKQYGTVKGLKKAINSLANESSPPQNRQHRLHGTTRWECHLPRRIVLIYRRSSDTLTLYRVGEHKAILDSNTGNKEVNR